MEAENTFYYLPNSSDVCKIDRDMNFWWCAQYQKDSVEREFTNFVTKTTNKNKFFGFEDKHT